MYPFLLQHELEIALLLAILILVSGCAARVAVHPGALNSADSAAYDALLVARTAIDQAKAAYAAGQIAGNKQALDALIAAYDAARASWLAYRGALMTNVSATTYLNTLNSNLTALSDAIRGIEEVQ